MSLSPKTATHAPWLGQISRFAMVGALGFLVDLGFTVLLSPALGPAPGRIAAIMIAVATTFWLNRQVTFAAINQPLLTTASRYWAVNALGAGINFGIYWGVLAVLIQFGWSGTAKTSLIPAVACGSGAAMAFNFLGAKFFAFAK